MLVIEDDPDMQAIVRTMLDGLGYRAFVELEGSSGLAALERGNFSAVLSDVVLPGGMSGPEFAVVARQRYPDLKIVFMSGFPMRASQRAGFIEGGNTFLAKPFYRRQLAQAMADAISA